MKTWLLIFYLFTACYVAGAQSPASFFVFGVQGKGYYSRDKFKIPLKIGTSLSFTDELILNPNTEVKIICNSYSLFTIGANAAGMKVPMKNYTGSCEVTAKSTMVKVLKYIWVSLKNEENNFSANNDASLQEYGAIVRGCSDETFSSLPDTICVYKRPLLVKYHPEDTAAVYVLKIFSNASVKAPVAQVKLANGGFLVTNEMLNILGADHNYYYAVLKNGMEYCQRKVFRKLGDASFASINKEINADGQYRDLSGDEKKFAAGFFFEKNNLPGEAFLNYSEAVKINPKNTLAVLKKKDLEKIVY